MTPVPPLSPEAIAALNPGIRATVQWLREKGFNTCDSGDGQTHDHACDLPVPFVHIRVCNPCNLIATADFLMVMLKNHHGIDFNNAPHPQDDPEAASRYPHIEASYSPVDGVAIISLFNVMLP